MDQMDLLPEERGEIMDKTQILRDFKTLFFAMNRINTFPWTFLEKDINSNTSSDLVLDVLKETCLHSLCRKFPPSVKFRRLFLSEIIRRQEAVGCEPLDELYDALAEVLGAEETDQCYKSYLLPSGEAVSLLESVALISSGTTGLVTWEAALYLAEWALDHRDTFTGRSVLELGSGVGLTGITISLSCSPRRFVFSDAHRSVLQKLRHNVFKLNGLSGCDVTGPSVTVETTSPSPTVSVETRPSPPTVSVETRPIPTVSVETRPIPTVSVETIDWSLATDKQLKEIGADVVIAADVVYDPEVAVSLVKLLSRILTVGSPQVFICSTVRNQDTYGGFKQQLECSGIRHRVIEGPVSPVFPYNRLSHVEMIELFT